MDHPVLLRNKERNNHLTCGEAEEDPLAHRGARIFLAARFERRLRPGVVLVLDGAAGTLTETCCSQVR